MNIPFPTTPEEADHLRATIVPAMEAANVDAALLVEATTLALFDQGAYDLMALWLELESERDAVLGDLRDLLRDHRRFNTSIT